MLTPKTKLSKLVKKDIFKVFGKGKSVFYTFKVTER